MSNSTSTKTGRKCVQLSQENYDGLRQHGFAGESMDKAMTRLLKSTSALISQSKSGSESENKDSVSGPAPKHTNDSTGTHQEDNQLTRLRRLKST